MKQKEVSGMLHAPKERGSFDALLLLGIAVIFALIIWAFTGPLGKIAGAIFHQMFGAI